jgi:hypothetical protein
LSVDLKLQYDETGEDHTDPEVVFGFEGNGDLDDWKKLFKTDV